jgi:hypothetical protein
MSRIKFEELLRLPGQSVVSQMQMLKKRNILKILLLAKTYFLVISINLLLNPTKFLKSKLPSVQCKR